MGHITTLPPELHHQIFQHIDLGDKLRLSSTSQQLRALLAPSLFQTIRFTNDETIANSALAAVETYGNYTTWLQFTGHAGAEDDFASPALPAAASELLGGKHTPNLRTVKVKFEYNFDSSETWDDNPDAATDCESIYVFDVAEDALYVQMQESERKWRALMTEAWQALAANLTVKELIIDDLIPKWTSAFCTTEFQQFLGRLESASISVLGMDNGAGWKSNTTHGYLSYLAELDRVFFCHMGQLKSLSLCASEVAPLGLSGYHHAPLALKAGDLPALESLKLQNCFVGPELVEFMQGHNKVLTSLELKDCVSGGTENALAGDSISWDTFFSSLRKAKLALLKLTLDFGSRAPLTRDEEFQRTAPMHRDIEPENIKQIRQKIKDNPRLKIFGNAYLDDKYGMWFMSEEENVERFEKGEDQKAYDRLMAAIRENSTR